MSNQLSDRINSVTPSATLEMAAKARELRAQGKDIIMAWFSAKGD